MVYVSRTTVVAVTEETKFCAFFCVVVVRHCDSFGSKCWYEGASV